MSRPPGWHIYRLAAALAFLITCAALATAIRHAT